MSILIKWKYKNNIILEGILHHMRDDGSLSIIRHRKNRGKFKFYSVNPKNIIKISCLRKK